ncbi:hypothetical protein [Nostoc sp.]|uniref:hypothetical protein n=1 Tax=Nostoc sp. TaxID=1180 RepID=UPI002FF69BE0
MRHELLVSKVTTFSQKSTGAGILDRAIAKLFGLLKVIPGLCMLTIRRKQIVIKKLLAKFPQWGIVIVDGVLLDW